MQKKRNRRKMMSFTGAVLLACVMAMPAHSVVRAAEKEPLEQEVPAEDDTEETGGLNIWEEEASEFGTPVLKTASGPGGVIKISWAEVEGAEKYVLSRSTKKDGGFKKICETGADACTFEDRECVPGKKYYYKLTAVSGELRTESKTKAGRALSQVTITEISNVSGSKKLVLHWKSVKGADSYQIMRKNGKTGEYEKIGTVTGDKTEYTDKKRVGGETYTYRVCAKDESGGRGSYSKEMSQMAIDKDKKMIALTYDDGPSVYTPVVLKAVEKYKVHVTFFIVGNRAGQYGDSLRREIGLGCEIGNHTYEHTILSGLGEKLIKEALDETSRAVKNQTGVDIRLMRPPGGGYNSVVRAAAGMPVIMWSIDTRDWQTRSTSATIQCVSEKAYDGAIVLMHDIHSTTVKAADEIIRQLKSRGYQLVTVSEMAAYRGGLENGKVYNQFRK